jgi:hypothetical protein
MKEVKLALYPNRTPSPSSSEERESNPPTPFEQRYASYESFDPSQLFAPYASTSHMGFASQLGGDVGQQGPSSVAPPPEQPRPSMADEFAASISSNPNPSMASSPMHLFQILLSHHSLTHPSSLGQEGIGRYLATTSRQKINRSHLKLRRTSISSLFDDC